LDTFEHYQLLKDDQGKYIELGHGGMGVTYKAFDTSLYCHVALKVIAASLLGSSTAEERFLREARSAAQLRHRKVIDFGLVKSAIAQNASVGGLTAGGFVGTPYFAGPEQLEQKDEDVRSDIYSLGITLWYMLTGKPTFSGSLASAIAQHLDKSPPFENGRDAAIWKAFYEYA
jgi:serine/threonine protein kinase